MDGRLSGHTPDFTKEAIAKPRVSLVGSARRADRGVRGAPALPVFAITSKAPARGWLFAETERGSILERYVLVDGEPDFPGAERLEGVSVRRLHCFDEQMEYRYLRVNEDGDATEGVFTSEQEATMDPDLVYADKMVLKEAYAPKDGGIWALNVVNRYRWTESNALELENYRMAGVRRED